MIGRLRNARGRIARLVAEDRSPRRPGPLERNAIVARAEPIVWFVSRVGSFGRAVGTDERAHGAARRAMRGLIATAVDAITIAVLHLVVNGRVSPRFEHVDVL
jgi:hypothetical protein